MRACPSPIGTCPCGAIPSASKSSSSSRLSPPISRTTSNASSASLATPSISATAPSGSTAKNSLKTTPLAPANLPRHPPRRSNEFLNANDGRSGAPGLETATETEEEANRSPMKYADAGVDIAVADDAKQRIRHHASRTFTPGVLGGIGSFGALFALDRKKWKEPVLVSSADGVGTKLKVAMAMGVHSTVGGDLVNHCINDILVQAPEPLFFLDYLAMGKLDPQIVEQLVEGMSRSCRKAGCALIGGETAEMPGLYPPGEYDLARFIVGVVERKNLLTGKIVQPGDTLIALPSAGLHTNGYSLARKLAFEVAKLKPDTYVVEVGNKIGAELLKPHLCYAPALKNIVARGWDSALAHITGGGIPGNLPRVLPSALKAGIDLAPWPVPPVFSNLAKVGKIH